VHHHQGYPVDVGLLISIAVNEEFVHIVFDAGFTDGGLVESVLVLGVDLAALGDGGCLEGGGGLDLILDFLVIVGGTGVFVGVGFLDGLFVGDGDISCNGSVFLLGNENCDH